MKTVSLQNMPNGLELELPPVSYWVKAGVGLTCGATATAIVVFPVVWYLYLRFALFVLQSFAR